MDDATSRSWSLAPGEQVLPLEGRDAALRRVEVQAGHMAERHSHAHEQFLLVMEVNLPSWRCPHQTGTNCC